MPMTSPAAGLLAGRPERGDRLTEPGFGQIEASDASAAAPRARRRLRPDLSSRASRASARRYARTEAGASRAREPPAARSCACAVA